MDIFLVVLKGVCDYHPECLKNKNKEIKFKKKKKVEPQISESE